MLAYLLFGFVMIDFICCVALEFLRFKLKKDYHDISWKNNDILYKTFCLFFWTSIFIILIFIFFYEFALFIISFLCFTFCFWKIASHINFSPPLSENDEFYYLGSLGFYFSFFGLFSYSDITSYIFSTFNNGSVVFICFTLIYLILLIVLYIYSLMLSIVLFIHCLYSILIFRDININFELNRNKEVYDLLFVAPKLDSYKNRIIYFVFVPVLYCIDILTTILIKLKRGIKNLIKRFCKLCLKIYANRNQYTIKILLFSLIFALLFTYIFIVINVEIIGTKIKDIFELVATVIIIPIIFDWIKDLKFKSKNN